MMTVAEILEQVKALSPQERTELKKLLNNIPDSTEADIVNEPNQNWGKNLIRLLDEIGPIELVHPEIEDSVEWVKTIRREERQRRLGDWGDHIDTEDSVE